MVLFIPHCCIWQIHQYQSNLNVMHYMYTNFNSYLELQLQWITVER